MSGIRLTTAAEIWLSLSFALRFQQAAKKALDPDFFRLLCICLRRLLNAPAALFFVPTKSRRFQLRTNLIGIWFYYFIEFWQVGCLTARAALQQADDNIGSRVAV